MILLIKYIYNKEKSDRNIGKYQRIIGDVGLFSVGQDFQLFLCWGWPLHKIHEIFIPDVD